MNASNFAKEIDALYRIPLFTDGPWFFAPVQLGTPPQAFNLMLDTGSSLSWIQTTDCQDSPTLCNGSPKFNASLSSTLVYRPETIAVKYTEGFINTQLVSDTVVLGISGWDMVTTGPTGASENDTISNNTGTGTHYLKALRSREARSRLWPPFTLTQGTGTFGLTSNVAGDSFLLKKEKSVPGFLGASQRRFESDSDYSTHVFSKIIRELPVPVFSLAFADTWGTLTLGGPDPSFYSEPMTWIETLPDEAAWVTTLSSHIEVIPRDFDPENGMDPDFVRTEIDRVWFDSGTTYIWGDESAIRPLNEWMGADALTGRVDCTAIPGLGKIVFSIGGTEGDPMYRLELSPAEYIIGKVTSNKCFSALNASGPNKKHWIFGLHLLRGFYTVYHYGYGLVGIAPYNITATNPVGRLVLPGSHASLEQDVQKTLKRVSSSSAQFSKAHSQSLLPALIVIVLIVLFAAV